MTYEHRIVIGDWSRDGHNEMEFFTFQCSHDEKEIKKAYLAACKKCKVYLHGQDSKGHAIKGAVCEQYQESSIPAPQLQALKDLGVSFDKMTSEFHKNDKGEDELCCGPEDIAQLFFEMTKTQIPDFEFKRVEEKKPINGFWSKDFNYGFGYGCFSN